MAVWKRQTQTRIRCALFLRQNTSCSLIFLTKKKKKSKPLLQKLTTNLFLGENICNKMYQSYVQRFWKEYKTPMMKPGLREHMPKEETSRQQVTNSHSRTNRLDLPTDTFNVEKQYANKAHTLRQYKTWDYKGNVLSLKILHSLWNLQHRTEWKMTQVSFLYSQCPPSHPPWGWDSGLAPKRLQPCFGQQIQHGLETELRGLLEIPRNNFFFLNAWILGKKIFSKTTNPSISKHN